MQASDYALTMTEEDLSDWYKDLAGQYDWLRYHGRPARQGSAPGNQVTGIAGATANTSRSRGTGQHPEDDSRQRWVTALEGDKGFMDWTASKVLPRVTVGWVRRVAHSVELKSEKGAPSAEQLDWLSRTPNAWLVRPRNMGLIEALLVADTYEVFTVACDELDGSECLVPVNGHNRRAS